MLSVCVLLLPLLSLIKSCLEFGIGEISKAIFRLTLIFQIEQAVVVGLGQIERAIAVLAVKRVSLLILARVSFPSEVRSVDLSDKQVHFVARAVFQVHVSSLLACHLLLRSFHFLDLSLQQVDWLYIFLFNNLIILHLASVECLSFFEIVVFNLLSAEASHLMVLKGRCTCSRLLHEAHHGLRALGVEFVIISRLNLAE